jgi:hypothetical protein
MKNTGSFWKKATVRATLLAGTAALAAASLTGCGGSISGTLTS